MHQTEKKIKKQWTSLLWRSRVTSDHVSSSSGQLNLTIELKTHTNDPSQKSNIWQPIYLWWKLFETPVQMYCLCHSSIHNMA